MRIRVRAAVLAVASVVALSAVVTPPASAERSFADAGEATIHPGVRTNTAGAGCTANFVFTDGTDLFLGQAAHCSSLASSLDTDGCTTRSHPIGTPVGIQGADRPGKLFYSSWITMQGRGERRAHICEHNDFALVKIHPADHHKVNPSLPFWGGPVVLDGATRPIEDVYTYGSSRLRLGVQALSPKTGRSLGTTGRGWSHRVYTLTPGIPGDSGSGFLDADGDAVGVLSTIELAPLAASNGVTDLRRALAYANRVIEPDVTLVPGTEPFSPVL